MTIARHDDIYEKNIWMLDPLAKLICDIIMIMEITKAIFSLGQGRKGPKFTAEICARIQLQKRTTCMRTDVHVY